MSPVCTPWELNLECCELPDGDHDELIANKQAIASNILWAASGRRWGTCPVTVRPCLRRCGGGSGLPVPYKDADGQWRNYGACGCRDDCSCVELCEVILEGPVASVTEVIIDGTALDPDQYRLDKVGTGWRLLRVDGSCWPSCSDMTVDCDQIGSFCVTYEQGIELDALAIAAVSDLTCQLVRACLPNCQCALPANVASIVRRGVAIQFDTAVTWLRTLPSVAMFLDSANPDKLTSPSSVWSPDVGHQRVTPQPAGS